MARWVYEYVTYANGIVGSVRGHLESLAENWNPADAQVVMEAIKGHLQSGRDTMVTVMDKVSALAPIFRRALMDAPVIPVRRLRAVNRVALRVQG